MDRKSSIALVLGCVIICLTALVFYQDLFYPCNTGSDCRVDGNKARDIVKDSYPEANQSKPVFEKNCYVCDEHGCRYLSGPCWKINATTDNGTLTFTIEPRSGKILNVEMTRPEEPCTGWRCNPKECKYFYNETTLEGEILHYNDGCENPTPTCDTVENICRPCNSNSDCLRKRVSSLVMRTLNQILTWYEYTLIGTDVKGQTNDLSHLCEIYDGEGNELYYNQTTISECEEKMISYAECVDGVCKRAGG